MAVKMWPVIGYDLGLDWRWGAAWFEHCLIDFDPASNSGNWLSILGGTPDPRGGRRFNLEKQAWTYDRHHRYRDHWLGEHRGGLETA